MKINSGIIDKNFFETIVGRPELELLTDRELNNFLKDSRILIIGAGGSIGSAIARRLIEANLTHVHFFDRDESALHALNLSLSNISASQSNNCHLGDIRDPQSLNEVFANIKPEIVIHAAALKHLVVLERFPREGFLTNVLGTLNVLDICIKHKIEHFVNISTDKAANPVSILGKTKKLAEMMSEEVYLNTSLHQCSVRFGNVFASRGSVIETFIHQITHDLDVTITDTNVSRFFMSQNEAANLVLGAAILTEGGTYIQNMGQEVKILDIILRIAEHFKIKPRIKVIGLQPGEKLHEELYDGQTSSTKFSFISRSVHELKVGLVNEVRNNIPLTNEDSSNLINHLTSKYTSALSN